VKKLKLTSGKATMPMPVRDGRIDLRLLSDHSLVEIFTDKASSSVPSNTCRTPPLRLAPKLTAKGGEAKIVSLDVHELKSVWPISKKN
jgi:sucrose-6-phosphate hydrolase SacC (GH32 family)